MKVTCKVRAVGPTISSQISIMEPETERQCEALHYLAEEKSLCGHATSLVLNYPAIQSLAVGFSICGENSRKTRVFCFWTHSLRVYGPNASIVSLSLTFQEQFCKLPTSILREICLRERWSWNVCCHEFLLHVKPINRLILEMDDQIGIDRRCSDHL